MELELEQEEASRLDFPEATAQCQVWPFRHRPGGKGGVLNDSDYLPHQRICVVGKVAFISASSTVPDTSQGDRATVRVTWLP